jgi:hypothetical protein
VDDELGNPVAGAAPIGTYLTDDSCNVSGSITVGSATLKILKAKMANGGRIINGIQRLSGYGEETILFTMFRLE